VQNLGGLLRRAAAQTLIRDTGRGIDEALVLPVPNLEDWRRADGRARIVAVDPILGLEDDPHLVQLRDTLQDALKSIPQGCRGEIPRKMLL
jgi:hypothetical protein